MGRYFANKRTFQKLLSIVKRRLFCQLKRNLDQTKCQRILLMNEIDPFKLKFFQSQKIKTHFLDEDGKLDFENIDHGSLD